MSDPRSTKAEDTAAILQRAALGDVPVMIPGAFQKRVGRPPAPATVSTEPATPRAPMAAADDRERIEHEREGGGAPSERMGTAGRTILGRLWNLVLNPTHA